MLFIVLVTGVPLLISADKGEEEPIVESVTVTNVEVPVRVYYKNKPVTDLTKKDFEIYEDNKKMKINGFFVKRKKMGEQTTATGRVQKESDKIAPRVFVLVFNISHLNKNVKAAIDYLFEKILLKNDRVLIFANDKTLEYKNLLEKEKIKSELLKNLKRESLKVKARLSSYIKRIEDSMKVHNVEKLIYDLEKVQALESDVSKLAQFLTKYKALWEEYQTMYLTPDINRFYHFSKYLENIKAKKWVLNFYQFELFPHFRVGSRTLTKLRAYAQQFMEYRQDVATHAWAKYIMTLLDNFASLNMRKTFPTKEVSKLFYKVDATFHSCFIRTTNTAFMNDFDYKEVSSDIENTLKSITDITGGENIVSNNLVDSLKTIQEKEDVYYVLTYAPRDPHQKTGKIKVKVKRKKHKAFYDDNFRADYINEYLAKMEKKFPSSEVKIKDFSFRGKVLSFTVTDYLVKEIEKAAAGKVKVRIRLYDGASNSLFDQSKTLTTKEDEVKISIGAFKKLNSGEYNFLIDVVDLFNGNIGNFHQKVMVK